jgi:nucleoside-diphosphate-sugar epimerase
MRFTVLGSSGFIGSHVAALARNSGHEVVCPPRGENLDGQALGHVIYCIGLTADFRTRPHDTIYAHVSRLQDVLTLSTFDSLVYLSSTRVYSRCPLQEVVTEETPIPTLSQDSSDLYNLSKLLGESIGLSHGHQVKIARLANVVGCEPESTNFLPSIIRDSMSSGHIQLQTSLNSSKDYIHVDDVAKLLLRIGPDGQQQVYNVASGLSLTHNELTIELTRLTGATVDVVPDAPTVRFPQIDVQRIEAEFNFSPRRILDSLPELIWPDQSESEKAA